MINFPYKLSSTLTNEELKQYFLAYQQGDLEARQILIERNIRLVMYAVNNFYNNSPYEEDELFSAGLIGLIKSVDTYDFSKNIAFITYALKCIKNEILIFMRNNYKHLIVESYDKKDNNNETNIIDTISTKEDFTESLENKELYAFIDQCLLKLPSKDQEILKSYFGFGNNEPKTQEEIAKIFNLTQPNISREMKKNLQKIKNELLKEKLIEFRINQDSPKRTYNRKSG